MASSSQVKPQEIPPYELQPLVANVINYEGPFSVTPSGAVNYVRCAQALGSEIYVGCANGELLRYALEEDGSTNSRLYALQSRQSLPQDKPIDEIVLAPSIARALILSGSQVFFYTIPSLDPVPANMIAPMRNVIAFAVDEQHLRRPPPEFQERSEPIEFAIIKRNSIMLYSLRDRLFFQKDMPLPQGVVVKSARRSGQFMCYADKENYNMLQFETSTVFPLLPVSQAPPPEPGTRAPIINPLITVVGEGEFLIVSWTGASALGLFITGQGDPVRGTLEWPSYPKSMTLDYPFVTTLLANQTIEVHNIEDQSLVQVIPAPPDFPPTTPGLPPEIERASLVASFGRYMVPSAQASEKMKLTKVSLLRPASSPRPRGERGMLPDV